LDQSVPTRRQGVSAALAEAQAQAAVVATLRHDADAGQSLAAMAQRDLDAALQLLADRAQYITGASGAAIALRRDGRNDMLCRASVGASAPELGALLSTEIGLSGESVRTRQLLRCDDAERDARVNREVCRQLGIASVLVMPVVNDDKVLGVFELFSGKANAFGERDLSAVQRLSELVETAVRLAHATEHLPEQLSARESSVAEAMHPEVFEGQFLSDLVVEEAKQPRMDSAPESIAATALEYPLPAAVPPAPAADTKPILPEPVSPAPAIPVQPAPASGPAEKKPLFWSAAQNAEADGAKPVEAEQSHVPPVLRGLRKCEACGFPVSAGRVLCVECEEKKWRGQLRPQSAGKNALASSTVPKSAVSFAAAAPLMAKSPSAAQNSETGPKPHPVPPQKSPLPPTPARVAPARETQVAETSSVPAGAKEPQAVLSSAAAPEFAFTGGLEPSRSWLGTYKYILIALLVIAAGAAASFLLR